MSSGRFRHPFVRSEGGNVAIVFALMSLPLLGVTGAAIDYGLAVRLKTQLASATDATALMLCQSPGTTANAALQTQAETALKSFVGDKVGLSVDPLAITANPRRITVTAHASSATYFSKFVASSPLPISASAQCAPPVPKTFEIALVLDTTGSMDKAGGSGTKMAAARQAAKDFIDYVKGNSAFSADTRIAIVPFAASVAVDPATYSSAQWIDRNGETSYHWANVDKQKAKDAGFTSRLSIFSKLAAKNASWAWAGCFESQPYPYNVQDTAPSTTESLYVPLFAPDEPGAGSTQAVGFTVNRTTHWSYNSYLDDGTNASNCSGTPSTFPAAENRACKYVSPKNATSGLAAGTPNGPNFGCTSKPLRRLSKETQSLKDFIDTLSPSGATNIHEGFLWGWRTLSPSSVFADGVPYSTKTVNKVIVLMSDGFNSWTDNPNTNYNETLYFPMGYFRNADGSTPDPRLPPGHQGLSTTAGARKALDALTLKACENARNAGISIYTIGFSVPNDPIDAQGIQMLSDCASGSAQAKVANDSTALIAAFKQIASTIGVVRLTQ